MVILSGLFRGDFIMATHGDVPRALFSAIASSFWCSAWHISESFPRGYLGSLLAFTNGILLSLVRFVDTGGMYPVFLVHFMCDVIVYSLIYHFQPAHQTVLAATQNSKKKRL